METPESKGVIWPFSHIKDGNSLTESVKKARVPLRSVMSWVQKFRTRGLESRTDYEEFKKSVLVMQKNRPSGRLGVKM